MSITPQVKKPQTYNFEDWDFFCKDVLRFHEATRPNDKLISDYIETFVEFMESDVVKHLNDLMVPHPRYMTTVGKDVWLERVRKILANEDRSARSPITVEDSKSQYVAKKTTLAEFWAQLDRLVLLEEITSKEQRELFWESLPWKVEAELVKQCAYFDPRHVTWKGEDPDALKAAEQSLSWTISHMKCKDDVNVGRAVALGLIALLAVLGAMITVAAGRLSSEGWALVMAVTVISICASAMIFVLIVLGGTLWGVRMLQQEQQKVYYTSSV